MYHHVLHVLFHQCTTTALSITICPSPIWGPYAQPIFNVAVSPGNRPTFYFYFHPGLGPMFSSIHARLHVASPSHHLSLTHHLGHQQFIQPWTSNNFDLSGLHMPFSFHFISTSTTLTGAHQHCHLLHL